MYSSLIMVFYQNILLRNILSNKFPKYCKNQEREFKWITNSKTNRKVVPDKAEKIYIFENI